MYVCMYVYKYHWPAFVAPWFPRSMYAIRWSMHYGILTSSCAWFTTAYTESRTAKQYGRQDNWSYSLSAVKIINVWRQLVETDSAYWNGEAVAAWQLANAPLWIKNDQWAYCPTVLWRSYRQRLITYYSACMLLVEPYRLTVLRHHWHCCICSYCHYFNQLRLAWWLRRTLSRIADDMVYSSRREARELEAVQWCVDELWPHL